MNPIDSVTTWLRNRLITGRWFARQARSANTGAVLRRLQTKLAAAPASMDRAAALATAARGLQTVASLGGLGAPEMWRQGEMLWALADVYFDHAGLTGLRADLLAPFTDSTRQALRKMAAGGPGAQVEALSAILDTLGPEDPARSAVAVLQAALAATASPGGAASPLRDASAKTSAAQSSQAPNPRLSQREATQRGATANPPPAKGAFPEPADFTLAGKLPTAAPTHAASVQGVRAPKGR